MIFNFLYFVKKHQPYMVVGIEQVFIDPPSFWCFNDRYSLFVNCVSYTAQFIEKVQIMIEQNESQRAAMKEDIRKGVREEIQNSRNPQVTNIFSRTQDLISTATRAHSKALTIPPSSTFTFNRKKRSVPGHPNRFSRKKFRGGSVNRPKML